MSSDNGGEQPEVVTFVSSKGGSGKTVTSYCIAQVLAELKFQVLLIDADASTNGLTLLTLPSVTAKKGQAKERPFGLFDSDNARLLTAVQLSKYLSILPSTYRMRDTEAFRSDIFAEHLRVILETSSEYDFVLIDAQAGIDPFAKGTIAVADQAVIVSEYDPSSVEGIERMKVIFSDVLKIERTWVLFNKILPEFGRAIGDGLIVARYLPPIIWNADVVRAVATRESPVNFKSPTEYTLAIVGLMYRLFGKDVRERITAWLQTVKEKSTTPFRTRLEEVDEELRCVITEEVRLKHMAESGRKFILYSNAFFVLTGLLGIVSVFLDFKTPNSAIFNSFVGWPMEIVVGVGGAVIIAVAAANAWLDSRKTGRTLLEIEVVSLRRRDLERERERLIAAVNSADATLRITENYRSFG